jgi:hypothetical protein
MTSQAGVASTSLSATTMASKTRRSLPSSRVPETLAMMSSIACAGSGSPQSSTAITNGGETTSTQPARPPDVLATAVTPGVAAAMGTPPSGSVQTRL